MEAQGFIDPRLFGTLETLSSVYLAFENFLNTRITPFSETDVTVAISNGMFESRSFQSTELAKEFQLTLDKLSEQGLDDQEKDMLLADYARKVHISRVAYLVCNKDETPIEILSDLRTVTDGNHRVMAALERGDKKIGYIIRSI